VGTSGKQKKSPFKKFKNLFQKSPKTSPSNKNNHNTSYSLTSRNISASGNVSNYYSNTTDGFEVILEGGQLQYEENPSADSNSNQVKLCSTEHNCQPLFDWDYFVSVLTGNLNDIYHLFNDKGTNATTADVGEYGNRSGLVHGPIGAKNTPQKPNLHEKQPNYSHSSRRSLSFLNGTGVQEHAAIETTLEQGSNIMPRSRVSAHLGGNTTNSSSYHSNYENTYGYNSSSAENCEERIELHPFKKSNDAPISSATKSNVVNSSSSVSPRNTNHNLAIPSTSSQLSKGNAPEEEIYDTTFTLSFLKVRLCPCCLLWMEDIRFALIFCSL
jgi:hypothetical protein